MRRSQLRLPLLHLLILAVGVSIVDVPPVAAQETVGDAPVTAPEPDTKPAPLWDRLIYLPYKNLKTVFEKGDATVLIPYLEYLQLKKGASAMKAGGPPVSAVITESRYVARVEKDLVRIQATLTVQVLDKPWAQVPVSFGDAAVGKIKAIGKNDDESQALLRGTGKGTYSLLLPSKGTHTVELELVAQVQTSPDGRSFRFNCPPVGITTFEMVVPDADQTIEITPKRVALPANVAVAEVDDDVEPGEEEVEETRIKSSLGSTATISARWFPRTGLKPDMALLASVTNSLDVAIADGLVHTSATLNYQVLRGEIQQLRISAPLGHRILDVSAPGSKLKSWKAVDEEKRQLITVELLTAVRDAIAIEIHTEYDVPDAAFDVAGVLEDGTVNGIHAVDAVRENGLLAVSHGNEVTLSVEDQQGLIRVDAAEVAKLRRRAGSLYYKFYSPRFRLNVAANAVEPRITAQQTIRVIFGDDELKLHSVLALNVERAGIFELQVQLPAGLTVDTVDVDGKKEHAVDAETQILTVSLTEKRQGAIQLVVTGHLDFDPEADDENQQLPLLEPLDMARETGLVYVYAPRSIEVITEEQNVSGAYPEPTSGGGSQGTAVVVSAWSYSRRPVAIPFRTRRKPTHLTADVGTTIDVGQQVVQVKTRLDYHVEFAGIDTFRFRVPAEVSAGILIETTGGGGAGAVGIKQRSPAAEAVDGWVTWTVVMQQEVTGLQSFLVTFDLKREAEADAEEAKEEQLAEGAAKPASGEVSVELVRVIGLDEIAGRPAVVMSAIQGEVVVLKDRALAVSAKATGGDVEPIDVRELQSKNLSRDAFLAYRYHKQPVSLAVTAEKHDIQEVVATVIPRALIEIVIGREEMATYRCRYRIISSERQRLAIDLPKGFEPLAVLIDGNPVTLEKNGGGDDVEQTEGASSRFERRFVNVARRKASDEPFYLTIQFRAPAGGGRLGSSLGGKETLPLPRIGGEASAAVAVQQLQTAVWIPEEYALVGGPLNFVAQTHARLGGSLWGPLVGQKQTNTLEEWIGGGQRGSADFPTEGHAFAYSSLSAADAIVVTFYHMSYLAWFLSLTLLLVAGLLLRTNWENKLGFLLLAGFLATLIALANADWVFHGLVAARFGIAAMLAWWLIHALAAMRRSQPPTSTTPPTPTGPIIPPAGAFRRYEANPGGSGKW